MEATRQEVAIPAGEPLVIEVESVRSRKVGPFGVGSFVFAMLALLICWVPFLNLASLPLALIGVILGLMGIVLAITGKRYSMTWPISSLVMCLLAVILTHQMWVRIFSLVDTATAVAKQLGNAAENATTQPKRIQLGPPK
jgi:hypothetical protein